MSSTQKTLLGCSTICYLLVLAGFFTAESWMILLFFILHSISLLSFTYLSRTTISNAHTEEEFSRLEEQLLQIKQKKEELEKTLEESFRRISSLEEEAAAALVKIPVTSEPENKPEEKQELDPLLPPLKENEDPHETMDIIQVAQATVGELFPFAQKAGVQIHISSPTSTLLMKANPMRIRILFRNIIDNSIKYMNRAGSLVITISTVGSDIFIVLKDNGNGLPEEETPHIFELNYQGSNRISGNGLGLTQAKAIVDYYGGTIYAKSTPGKGMGIYIQIPLD